MITEKEVEHVAKLAQLHLSREEKELFTKQLVDILNFVDKLKELNTDGIEPTKPATVISVNNVFRNDKVKESLDVEESLKNSPDKQKGYFKIPKIME
ncbi:MAG: Asp-tRNA(Asn)/Glu-tRNA(Gln) amidotransferase subunit GatC [Candidatus Firestonebacteria bacterium]